MAKLVGAKRLPKPKRGLLGGAARQQLRHLSPAVMIEELGPPGLLSRAGMIIGVLVVAAIVWAAVAPLTQSANAIGHVVPDGSVHQIQHLEGGIVEQILVRDGQIVGRGEPLVRLSGVASKADLAQMRTRSAVLSLRSERLRAFIAGDASDFAEAGRLYPELALDQSGILAASRQSRVGSLSVLRRRLEQRRGELAARTQKIVNLGEQVEVSERQLAIREELYAKELGSLVQVLTARAGTTRLSGLLADERAAAEQAKEAVAEANDQIAEREATILDAAILERAEVEAERAEVDEAVKRLVDRVDRLDVRAPVRGVVDAVQVNTVGAIVAPGDTLLQVVPIGDEMLIEARIDPRDIGFISIGQAADITFDGFDTRRFGRVAGAVRHVSATTFTGADNKPFYMVRIGLDSDRIEANGRTHQILPGMAAQAQINTGTETVLGFLLRPIYASLLTAFNER